MSINKKGIVLVELLLAFSIWALFLSALVPLWSTLANPDFTFTRYVNEEGLWLQHIFPTRSFVDLAKIYIDRNIFIAKAEKEQNSTMVFDWKNSFAHSACRDVNFSKGRIMPQGGNLFLDGQSIPQDMKARGHYIYLTADSATSSDADFYIADIKDPDNPLLVSKIDTGPGLRGLYLAGYTAYAANSSVNSQAVAITFADPLVPAVTWSFKVAGSHGTTTSVGKSIASDGARIYIGTEKSTFPELFVVDALTHQEIAHAEIGAAVNGIYIDHFSIYIASPLNPELSIFPVPLLADTTSTGTTPSALLLPINSYEAPGSTGNGKSLDVVNMNVYLGRTLGGNELIELVLGSTSAASLKKTKDAKIGATIDAMVASKDYLYVLTANSGKEFQIWHRDASSSWSLSSFIDLPGRAVALSCAQGRIFVALGMAGASGASGTTSPIIEIGPDP